MLIGVLGFQGSFVEHLQSLRRAQIANCLVRQKSDLGKIAGLIIPGGESTTIGHLLKTYDMLESLKAMILNNRLAVWGTCAGMILLAKEIVNAKAGQPNLSVMDITVARNAFGRQIDSFEEPIKIEQLGPKPFPCVFIRAPHIIKVKKNVQVLGQLKNGTIVAAQQEKMLATAFHPELTNDLRFHQYFASLANSSKSS